MPRVKEAASFDKIKFAREQRREPTKAEKILWQVLRNSGLGVKFRRQHPFDIFILDFYCDSGRLAVEVDGPVHDEQVRYDRWRDGRLTEQGIRVLRFPSELVEADGTLVEEKIREELEQG